MAQIEVTFDTDANGILSVSARDKDTGTEQRVEIEESANLMQADIERMISEAQLHADEDKQRRGEADARNELDTLAYQADRLVGDLQDKLPVHEKARAEQLIGDARKAVEEQAPLDHVRGLTADLQQIIHSLPAAGSASGLGAPADAGQAQEGSDDEVVDADFTRE
jgi:molecular chaperone DnaK